MPVDIAPLGFAIDTDALKRAGVEAVNTGRSLTNMGDATDAANKKAEALNKTIEKSAEGHKKHRDASKESTEALRQHAQEADKARQALEALSEAHGKVTASAHQSSRAHLEAVETHHQSVRKSAQLAAQQRSHLDAITNFHRTGGMGGHDSEHDRPEHRGLMETREGRGFEYALARAGGGYRRYGPAFAAGKAAELGATAFGGSVLGIAEMGLVTVGIGILAEKLFELGKEVIKVGDAAQQTQAKFQGLSGRVGGAENFENFNRDATHSGIGRDAYLAGGMSVLRENPNLSGARAGAITQGLGRLNTASGGDDKSFSAATASYSSSLRDGVVDLKELQDLEKSIPRLPEQLGQSRDRLHEMAAEGKLTTAMFEDMIAKAGPGLDKAIGQMPDQFHLATTRLASEWDLMLENMGKSTHLTGLATRIAEIMADAFDPEKHTAHAPTTAGGRAVYHALHGHDYAAPSAPAAPAAPAVWHAPQFGGGTLLMQQQVISEANRQGVDPRLALQVLFNESRGQSIGFHPGAGESGPYGPMGVSAIAAKDAGLDPASRFTTKGNIAAGVGELRVLSQRTGGNITETARRYHAGTAAPRGPVNAAYASSVAGLPGSTEIDDAYGSSLMTRSAAARAKANTARQQAQALHAAGRHDEAKVFEQEALRQEEEARGADAQGIALSAPETPFSAAERANQEKALGLNDSGISAEASARLYQQQREARGGSLGTARAQVIQGRVLDVRQSTGQLNASTAASAGVATATAQGPAAVREADIAQKVAAEQYQRFGNLALESLPGAKSAMNDFEAATRRAAEQTQRLADAGKAYELRQTGVGLANGLSAGYTAADQIRAQRAETLRRETDGMLSGSAAGYAVVSSRNNRLEDLGGAKSQIDQLMRKADDLGEQMASAGLSPERRQITMAGNQAVRNLSDQTDLAHTDPAAYASAAAQVRALAEASAKAALAVTRYSQAHDEISGSITGGAGGLVRGMGSLTMSGQLSTKSLDALLTKQLSHIGDTIIDNLIAKPVERATEGIANQFTDWLMKAEGGATDTAMKSQAVASMTNLTVAAGGAAAALRLMSAAAAGSAGGSIGNSFASAFASEFNGGTDNTMSAPQTAIAFGANFRGGMITPLGFGGGVGRILNRPMVTPLANGSALAGEVDAEAVLPLKRGPDGKLGVGGGGSGGGGVNIVVNDMRSKGGAPVQTASTTGSDGRRTISLTIRDEVRGGLGTGDYDASMRGRYGAQPVIARR